MKESSTIRKLLVVPAERYPTNESFVDRVLSRLRVFEQSIVIMQTTSPLETLPSRWNQAELVLFPARPGSRLLRWIRAYFTDLRYLAVMFGVLRRARPQVVLVRDMTFPLLVVIAARPFFGMRIVYQKTFPNEIRWFDRDLVEAHRWPWLWRVCRWTEERLLRWGMRRADAVLPISAGMGEQLTEEWGVARDRWYPFGMGVDPEELGEASVRSWSEPEVFCWVYLGTLGRSRRLETMLRSFARAREMRPALDMKLDIVGGLPEEIERLQAVVRDCGLEGAVRFWGRLPRREAFDRVRRAHASLVYIPRDRRYRIASPAKLIESLALGVPAVSTDACEVTAELARETGGVIVTSDSVDEFASGMLQLVDSYPVLAKRVRSARTKFVARHSYERMRERLASILDSLVPDAREE